VTPLAEYQSRLAQRHAVAEREEKRFRWIGNVRLLTGICGVTVAFFVFGEHQQVVISVAVGWSASDDVVVFFADVEFAAHDRFHSDLVRGIYKMHRAKNVAVIGHGDRRHAKFMNPVNKFLDVASAIEQGVIAMQMEVDELVLAHEDCTWLLADRIYSTGWRDSRNDRKWCNSQSLVDGR